MEYTDPSLVMDIKTTETPVKGRFTTGYGSKIPTSYMVKYLNKWRRVYVVNYANSGSAYIVVNGSDVYLDSDTDHNVYNYR